MLDLVVPASSAASRKFSMIASLRHGWREAIRSGGKGKRVLNSRLKNRLDDAGRNGTAHEGHGATIANHCETRIEPRRGCRTHDLDAQATVKPLQSGRE